MKHILWEVLFNWFYTAIWSLKSIFFLLVMHVLWGIWTIRQRLWKKSISQDKEAHLLWYGWLQL